MQRLNSASWILQIVRNSELPQRAQPRAAALKGRAAYGASLSFGVERPLSGKPIINMHR